MIANGTLIRLPHRCEANDSSLSHPSPVGKGVPTVYVPCFKEPLPTSMVFTPPSRYFPLVSGSSTNLPRSRGTETPVGKGVPSACVPCMNNYEEKPRKHIFKGYHFFEMVVLLRC